MRLVTLKDAARITGRPLTELEALVEVGALTWRVCSRKSHGTVRFYALAVMRADLKELEKA